MDEMVDINFVLKLHNYMVYKVYQLLPLLTLLEYIDLAKKRLAATTSLKDEIVSITKSRRDLPKVPFGELVEQGIIPPGAVLTDSKNRYKAIVKIDGTISSNNITGSIHQVGAKIQGLPSCNGWDYWHLENNRSNILLDALRDQYRKIN